MLGTQNGPCFAGLAWGRGIQCPVSSAFRPCTNPHQRPELRGLRSPRSSGAGAAAAWAPTAPRAPSAARPQGGREEGRRARAKPQAERGA